MRIATLQIASKLGDLEGNIKRANEILNRGKVLSADLTGLKESISIETERLRPDILVLPEMGLTGM